MDQLLAGLDIFLSLINLFAILGGVILGVIVGAIPGLTGTMAVSLALPFTFNMPTISAILLLVGIYKGSIYGGSIPAVLLKTPGTPAASCTVLDGHPLMEKGLAQKALLMSLYASCTADLLSTTALILFTGYIAKLALSFGPAEFFTLICFSLTIIAGVSGESLLKGLIAASLGLLLATVGMDTVYGTNRFVFDITELMGGISFIPILIGIFALPEMLRAINTHADTRKQIPQQNVGVTKQDLKYCSSAILRGSLLGIILGAIPGIGSAPATFLAYSDAKRRSKNPELFGKGSLEGVAAAESGNSGVCAAAMIPLLSLGVPGDVISGIILGAFMMHGISAGPLLFTDHAPLVYAIYAGFLFSSICLLGVGLAAIRAFCLVVRVPFTYIYPAMLLICFFGVYAVNNSLFDILLMVLSGVLGYFMMRFSFPAPPFLIAFILGPLWEDNLRRSLTLSEGQLDIFISSPFCIFFVLLTLLSLFLIVRQNYKKSFRH